MKEIDETAISESVAHDTADRSNLLGAVAEVERAVRVALAGYAVIEAHGDVSDETRRLFSGGDEPATWSVVTPDGWCLIYGLPAAVSPDDLYDEVHLDDGDGTVILKTGQAIVDLPPIAGTDDRQWHADPHTTRMALAPAWLIDRLRLSSYSDDEGECA